jgi:hypothetical protein
VKDATRLKHLTNYILLLDQWNLNSPFATAARVGFAKQEKRVAL